MNIKYKLLFFLFFVTSTPALVAQPGTTTEAVVKLQDEFIAASRDRILGNYEKSIEGYRSVLKQDPKNHAASYELARVYDVLDEDESALKSIQKAVNLNGKNMWYRMFLADVLQKMNKHNEASVVFQELVEENPDSEYHYFKQAFCLVAAKKPEEAIKVYNQMEKKFGINEETSKRKHALYIGLGDNKKAANEIQQLIKRLPDNTSYYHLLAEFYESIKDMANAKATYKKILAMDPEDAKAAIAVAGTGSSSDIPAGGSDVTYLQTLKPIFQMQDEDIDVKIKALMPYINKVADFKDPALTNAALELAEILIAVHPDEAKSHSVHGDLLYHANKPQEALAAYEKTLDIHDNVFAVWEQVMYIHAESYNMDELIKTSEKAMDIFPNQPKIYYLNGIANIEKKQFKKAAPNLEQALMMSGRKNTLKLDILAKLGIAYSELNNFEKAEKKLKTAMALKADSYRVQDAMAWMHFKQKEYDEAKSWLDKALKNGGDKDATTLEHYGDLMFQTGNKDKANQYWLKAQNNGGRSPFLQKKITNKKLG